MGSPGGKVPWQATLLAASILSSCFVFSRGQDGTITNITVEPPMPKKGGSVTLKPGPLPERVLFCRWYRESAAESNCIITGYTKVSGDTKGHKYTGRETVNSNCTLEITDLIVTDSGIYIMTAEGPGVSVTRRAEFEIRETPRGGGHLSGGAIAGIAMGGLALVILLIGPMYFMGTKTSSGTREHHISNG